LNRTIVDFILENKEPEEIPECCIQNAMVKAAIEEVSIAHSSKSNRNSVKAYWNIGDC
jgi:hypothetical protein